MADERRGGRADPLLLGEELTPEPRPSAHHPEEVPRDLGVGGHDAGGLAAARDRDQPGLVLGQRLEAPALLGEVGEVRVGHLGRPPALPPDHHYSTLRGAAFGGHHRETLLRPLGLGGQEIDDLVAFLESLTDQAIDPDLLRPP